MMEQSSTLQTQVLKDEEPLTGNDVQTTHVTKLITNHDLQVTIEDGQNLSNQSSLKSTLSMDNSNIHAESTSECHGGTSSTHVPTKEIDSHINEQLKSEADTISNNIQKQGNIEICEKDKLMDSDYGSQSSSTREGQSLNVISGSKIIEMDEKIEEVKSDAIKDVNQSHADKQCLTLHSQYSESQIADAHETKMFKETVKDIHDNDSNQNSSIVTDAELTKLVHDDTEVVVLVETIPVTTAENFIATLDEKNTDKECEQETVVTLQDKKNTEFGRENEKFNVIDCSQDSDRSVIEVISTEVIHTPIIEQCKEQTNKCCVKNIKCDPDTVKIIGGEIAISKDINNENAKIEAVVNKIVISTDDQEHNIEICTAKDDGLKTKGLSQIEDSQIKNTITKDIPESNQDDESVHETAMDPSLKKRSVIQDIFDDWGVENIDEDGQSTSKIHDSVEIELKSLLDETKVDHTVTNQSVVNSEETIISVNRKHATDDMHTDINTTEKNSTKKLTTEQAEDQKKIKVTNQDITQSKNEQDFSISAVGKTSQNLNSFILNVMPESHVAVPKNRSRHLSNQIASTAEVTEVLKERLREKQKVVDAPRGPDIFFVKKLTQRLSNKLAGSPVNPIPALIPLPQQAPSTTSAPSQSTQLAADNCDIETMEESTVKVETSKAGNSDNKELLAILEGDVDPDWSNLKPPVLTEEGKIPSNIEHCDHSNPPKLDPLVERELALKQLLELPITSSKKNVSRKKKTFKPVSSKVSKDNDTKSPDIIQTQRKIADPDIALERTHPNTEHAEIDLCSPILEKNNCKKEQDIRIEESRSGRKRKLTEKAREHEQNTIKRQKIYKGKVPINKKEFQKSNSTSDDNLTENRIVTNKAPEIEIVNNERSNMEEITNKQSETEVDTILDKAERTLLKRSKQNLTKKGSQSITKRKIVVKKLLRQKMAANKKSVKLKTKLTPTSKKSTSKLTSKSQKRIIENTSSDVKPKKKIINEIDRLLQDEGVVNLLYDVEQPDKKRLIPITKSRAKVMDLQKVQRELKIRKKLVRNAVLRLRTSTVGVTKVSPRSKRTVVHVSDAQVDRKMGEQASLTKIQHPVSPTEFMLPTKMRNAADASIIVRRHSSSSFSSASGSPRVSIDSPEKLTEIVKLDDGTTHSLRSTKRRHLQEEKVNAKKSKKKAVQKCDNETTANTSTDIATITTTTNVIDNNGEEKLIIPARSNKKSEIKRVDKASKYQENIPAFEESISSSKVTTRSNGTATGKLMTKSKRSLKNKAAFVRVNDPNNVGDSSKEEDELSACLAEAASALSVVNATSRSGNITVARKSKANTNTIKMLDLDSDNAKTEMRGQFTNKEINVRRYGNLVQLILTPSSSTKIRNALTLQVMQEFKEALSILKRDDECRVVLLTSTGTSFCEGLELSTLLCTNKEERRTIAQELAHAVKDFIKSLATFNKPIVAGVQGAAVGLGVTMLPLFDLVIASDKATFCTPYGKLGQIAEGAAVFTLSHILGSAITSELLLGGRTLTASEALRAGLVTRVLWPDRFQVELLPSLRAMSDQSSQSMEATKALLRHSLRKKLDAALESETYLLIQHWCSAECQTAIKAYIDGKIQ